MKKLGALFFLAISCVTSFGTLPQPNGVVLAQKRRGDDKPKKKDQPGPPVVREKRDREKPPPRKSKPKKPY